MTYSDPSEPQDADNGVTLRLPEQSFLCTLPLYLFLNDLRRSFDLFMFTVELADNIDEHTLRASTVLLNGETNEDDRRRYEFIIANPKRNAEYLGSFSSIN